MCGINGFNWENKEIINEMNSHTRFRGPDFSDTLVDDISMGHTRLSIIDLTDNANQPISNEDDTIWLTYNGEIYNFQELKKELESLGHIFKSKTDSEVIIHGYEQYGLNFFKKMNGMWSFSIYDSKKQCFILCRDRFGIKPLYYYSEGSKFIFSSMIGSILRHDIDRKINKKILMEFLSHNLSNHTDNTFFANIKSLSPGSLLIYSLKSNTYVNKKYYSIKSNKIEKADFLDLFKNAVSIRKMADVPVGCTLSGGIDSSSIVSVLSKEDNIKLKTFTFVSKGKLNEKKYADLISKKFEHEPNYVSFKELDMDLILDFLKTHEEPLPDSSPLAEYLVMKKINQQETKVILGGQGGDEIFGGYIYVLGYYFLDLIRNFNFLELVKEMIKINRNFETLFPHKMLFFLLMPKKLQLYLWHKKSPWLNVQEYETSGAEIDPRWKRLSFKQSLLLLLQKTSIPHNLAWEDKNSMRWSVETRLPLLDYRLVEASQALSFDEMIGGGITKKYFRELLSDIVPNSILERRDKIGYEAPTSSIFQNPFFSKYCSDVFCSNLFHSRPFWDGKIIESKFIEHVDGKSDNGNLLWKVFSVEIWIRMFIERKEKIINGNA